MPLASRSESVKNKNKINYNRIHPYIAKYTPEKRIFIKVLIEGQSNSGDPLQKLAVLCGH
jgi:hypothetical protein